MLPRVQRCYLGGKKNCLGLPLSPAITPPPETTILSLNFHAIWSKLKSQVFFFSYGISSADSRFQGINKNSRQTIIPPWCLLVANRIASTYLPYFKGQKLN